MAHENYPIQAIQKYHKKHTQRTIRSDLVLFCSDHRQNEQPNFVFYCEIWWVIENLSMHKHTSGPMPNEANKTVRQKQNEFYFGPFLCEWVWVWNLLPRMSHTASIVDLKPLNHITIAN